MQDSNPIKLINAYMVSFSYWLWLCSHDFIRYVGMKMLCFRSLSMNLMLCRCHTVSSQDRVSARQNTAQSERDKTIQKLSVQFSLDINDSAVSFLLRYIQLLNKTTVPSSLYYQFMTCTPKTIPSPGKCLISFHLY